MPAGSPFDALDSDCILRSSDNVDFRIHKVILSLASDVFNSMFALPSSSASDSLDFMFALPSSNSNNQETKDGLPVITLAEPFKILDPLLRLCYPVRMPTFTTLPFPTLMSLYDGVDKYAMKDIAQPILDALVEDLPRYPMTAFAFGCRHDLRNLAVTAAKETLIYAKDSLPYVSELDRITGSQLHRLYVYHRQCRAAASELAMSDWSWIPALSSIPLGTALNSCTTCRIGVAMEKELIAGMVHRTSDNKWLLYCPRWWAVYMCEARGALRKNPRGATVQSRELLGLAMQKAVQCNKEACRVGSVAMIEFSELFAQEVEKAIDAVKAPY
ncbi:uncharacterized protein STEHIDRAFT_93746 [Stereum hirsutum FP-91666 SS1]|uniref:uncharacterized protein n=1 Tax=Stereum hirsutum (strain FP-91666) TaxID=721885 RepID=UPI000440D7F8|nr:uncharacterized protein STEHIDRAFT_93746 [Stereum hirsutum FP-91666 SS1]EIM88769.1 hypothetical protein STEHIDRAFT_93746 [Stereum hirsutum FP-91666 SS1]